MRILLSLIENKLAQSVIAYWHTPPPRRTIVRSPDRSGGCSPAVRTQACTSCRRPRCTRCRSGRSRSSRSQAAVNPGTVELQRKIKVLQRSLKKGLAIKGNKKKTLNKNVGFFSNQNLQFCSNIVLLSAYPSSWSRSLCWTPFCTSTGSRA